MSNSSVSIILTAPSDDDASILMGTRFVIAAMILLLASRPSWRVGGVEWKECGG